MVVEVLKWIGIVFIVLFVLSFIGLVSIILFKESFGDKESGLVTCMLTDSKCLGDKCTDCEVYLLHMLNNSEV